MREIKQLNKFKRDIKLQKKRGKELAKIKAIINLLILDKPLSEKYRDHALIGNYKNSRECHIEPDWLLIYRIEGKTLYLERTGSHSDLF